MLSILVVDDEKSIRTLISTFLKQQGFDVVLAINGADALAKMDSYHIDLAIVDVMMPVADGYEFTKDIRSIDDKLPILMVTAKDGFEDKKKGFSVGIDDYMTKPIDLDEMQLRVNALLRRAKISTERKIEVGKVLLNYDNMEAFYDGNKVDLPKKEFLLLFKFLSYPNQIFTRRQLIDELWSMDSETDERVVDVHIKRVREKFENCTEFEIVTVWGLGYKALKLI